LRRNEQVWTFNRAAREAAKRIRERYPGVVGILVDGSVGRGNQGPFSDVDVLVIMRSSRVLIGINTLRMKYTLAWALSA
jgi:predicted nucleotidyltransferase